MTEYVQIASIVCATLAVCLGAIAPRSGRRTGRFYSARSDSASTGVGGNHFTNSVRRAGND